MAAEQPPLGAAGDVDPATEAGAAGASAGVVFTAGAGVFTEDRGDGWRRGLLLAGRRGREAGWTGGAGSTPRVFMAGAGRTMAVATRTCAWRGGDRVDARAAW